MAILPSGRQDIRRQRQKSQVRCSPNSHARGPAWPGLPFTRRWAWNSLSLSYGLIMAIGGDVSVLLTPETLLPREPPCTRIWGGTVSRHMPEGPTQIASTALGLARGLALSLNGEPTPSRRRGGPTGNDLEAVDLDNASPHSLSGVTTQVQRTHARETTVNDMCVCLLYTSPSPRD